LNVRRTKRLFEEHDVIALKADKDDKAQGVDELLRELGNTSTAIPYYAIFSPNLDKPIHFGGELLTTGRVREVIEEALGKGAPGEAQTSREPRTHVAAAEKTK
jgi:hypothetical protein